MGMVLLIQLTLSLTLTPYTGRALQLVNIARDVPTDLQNGREDLHSRGAA